MLNWAVALLTKKMRKLIRVSYSVKSSALEYIIQIVQSSALIL